MMSVPVERDAADEEALAEAAGAAVEPEAKSERQGNESETGPDANADEADTRKRDKRGRARGQGGRKEPSKETHTVNVTVKPDPSQMVDEHGALLEILHYEESSRLHYVPAQFLRLITRRPVYGHSDTGKPVGRADLPPAIIPKGKCTDAMIQEIIVRKFHQGIPLHRIIDEFNCCGVGVSSSLFSDMMRQAEPFFAPIVDAMFATIRDMPLLHVDETPMPYQDYDEEAGRLVRKRGYYVLFAAGGNVVVRYGPSRAAKHIEAMFTNVAATDPDPPPPDPEPPDVDPDDDDGKHTRATIGYFYMADGYAGYNNITDLTGLIRLACWAHARRYFLTPARHDPYAKRVLDMITELYRIERQAKRHVEKHKLHGTARDEHYERLRREQSQPVLGRLRTYLDQIWSIYAPDGNSRMAKAIAYIRNRWSELSTYAKHGFLPIDNNAAERSIRPLVVGRKSFQFVGSPKAGEWAATFYSLMESCRLAKLDPRAYLREATKQIHRARGLGHPVDWASLSPMRLKAAVKDAIKRQRDGDEDADDPLGLGWGIPYELAEPTSAN
jgi:transposase